MFIKALSYSSNKGGPIIILLNANINKYKNKYKYFR